MYCKAAKESLAKGTGYVKNREKIRLISNVIEFYEKKEQICQGCYRFSKRVRLLKVIIVPMFRKWIHTFYTYITSCVINNGYGSDFFQLYRGVRQGCPNWGFFFCWQ